MHSASLASPAPLLTQDLGVSEGAGLARLAWYVWCEVK